MDKKTTLSILIALLGLAVVGMIGTFGYLTFRNTPTAGRSVRGSRAGGQQQQTQTPTRSTAQEGTLAEAGKQTDHIEADGVNREFIVYRPENLPIDKAVPVVFVFHGSGETGEMFYENSGWKEKADAEGFVAVFPTALKYHIFADEKVISGSVEQDVSQYQTKWNSLSFAQALDPAYPNQVLHDDVAFVRGMVGYLEDAYAVDASRFYATGFSNGGSFVDRLVIEMPDVFAAFAPSSAGSFARDSELAVSEYAAATFTPRPVVEIIGSDDPKLTYASGVTSFPLDESAVSDGSALGTSYVDAYESVLQLSDTHTLDVQGGISHFTYAQPAAGSDSQAEYDLYIVDGMKHIYPNGTNAPISAVETYWDFFSRYSL